MAKENREIAILWALLSSFSFTCLMTVIKSTSAQFPIAIMILSRSFFGCLFLTPLVWKNGLHRPEKRMMAFYILRTMIAYTTIFATYYVYRNLPLHIATSIGYTEPMIQVAVSMLFLKATVSRNDWISILLGITGAAIIAYDKQGDASISFNAVMVVALLANLLASVAKGITKRLTLSEPTHQIMFYGYCLNFLAALISLLFLDRSNLPTKPPPTYVMALVPLIALLSSVSNYAYTKALSMTDIHVLSPVNYTKLFFALPFGFLLFKEIPTWLTLSGSLFIIMANYFVIQQDERPAKA